MSGSIFLIMVTMATMCLGQTAEKEEDMGWMVNALPDPMDRPKACGRNAASFICDPQNILPLVLANEIDEELKKIYENTTTQCYTVASKRKGFLVMMAVVPKMRKYFTKDADDNMVTRYREARSFAYHLGRAVFWGKHSTNCNEMVIILYSKEDKVLYTSTQSTARGVLTDDIVRAINLNTMTRFFPFTLNDRRAAQALKYMIRVYSDVLQDERKARKKN